MSYEGETEHLCENGHYNITDCHDTVSECYHCKAKIVWTNEVDHTNCEGVYAVKTVKTAQKLEKCNLNHYHVIEPATYYIPGTEPK